MFPRNGFKRLPCHLWVLTLLLAMGFEAWADSSTVIRTLTDTADGGQILITDQGEFIKWFYS